jgi:bidirectional [NiFe] hydrogenase diaphorase subunit
MKRHLSGDNRFDMLDATMKRHRSAPDALIEILHTAQELFGYLELDLLYYISHSLKLPPSRVYGVATFYHLFSLAPKGRHTCVVCTGTACYVKAADRLLAAIEERLGISAGQTTSDGCVSLLTARCVGTCALAPLAIYDGEVRGSQEPDAAHERMKEWR